MIDRTHRPADAKPRAHIEDRGEIPRAALADEGPTAGRVRAANSGPAHSARPADQDRFSSSREREPCARPRVHTLFLHQAQDARAAHSVRRLAEILVEATTPVAVVALVTRRVHHTWGGEAVPSNTTA